MREFGFCSGDMCLKNLSARKAKRLIGNIIYVYKLNKFRCLSTCLQTPECDSVNYMAADTMCELVGIGCNNTLM